jgi:hypothetical protein
MSGEDRSRSSEDAGQAPAAPRHGSISGVVRGAGGAPVRDALVSLDSDVGAPDIAQKTGEGGTFRFANLRPGRYVVNVHDGSGVARTELTVGEEREHEVTISTSEDSHDQRND